MIRPGLAGVSVRIVTGCRRAIEARSGYRVRVGRYRQHRVPQYFAFRKTLDSSMQDHAGLRLVKNERIDNLTCARYFAALLVLMHHAAKMFPMPVAMQSFFDNGYMGVTFFFVLSGFVIAASSYEEMQTPRMSTILHFYARRIARIVPIWLFLSLPSLIGYLQVSPPSGAFWSYLTFTQAWSGDLKVTFGFLALSWTLSCEMFFYFVFPAFAFVVGRLTRGHAGLLLLVAAAAIVPWLGAGWFAADPVRAALNGFDPGSPHRWLYRFPLMRFCEFALGVCLYLLWRRYERRWSVQSLRSVWRLIGAASVVVVIALMTTASPGPFTWTAAYIVPYATLVMALTALETRHHDRKAAFALLVLLGEASYSFYLVHQAFVLPMVFFSHRSWMSLLWTMVFCSAVSIGLYTLIETPARKWLTGFLKDRRPTEMSPAIREELAELEKA